MYFSGITCPIVPQDFKVNYGIVDYWLGIFVLEARRKEGQPCPPNTFIISAGIQRYYNNELKRVDLNFPKLKRLYEDSGARVY